MDMLVVAGLLGSGKTSMIMSLVGRVHEETGKRAAIIVNDFGSVGVDGKVLEKQGMKVMEFWGGCICCTLGSYLLSTVRRVAEEMDPDYIVIEPSGIADPESVLRTMDKYEGPAIDTIRTVVLIDASRFDIISKALANPLANQIKAAEIILINKVDEVDDEVVQNIRDYLGEAGYAREVLESSATEGTNLDQVYRTVFQ
ncbi:MAG: CobW family GTP-binding protein [Methanomassiliicoccales archaeon]